jgi:hypothetical protein
MNGGKTLTYPLLLQLTFIALKLWGVIHWTWWWVLSPVWIPGIGFSLMWLIFWLILVFESEEHCEARLANEQLRHYSRRL